MSVSRSSQLHNHPRLLFSSSQLERATQRPQSRLMRKLARQVALDANHYVSNPRLTYNPLLHNPLLLRAREVQTRVITLLVHWLQSGEETFRQAALADIRSTDEWEYWSGKALEKEDPDPMASFDLACGETCAMLALAYDWLYDTLTAEDRAFFHRIAKSRAFIPFLARTTKDNPAFWYQAHYSNWNAVCSGGAGMLALALLDEVPEARRVLKHADRSILPYMKELESTAGGWAEGIGYWNYGLRYAFWYLLSHERATDQKHPLLQIKAVKQTLDFPFDFCPHGQACGFGDVNKWSPLPFHYAAAMRFNRKDFIPQLDSHFRADARTPWPNAAEMLLLHPDVSPTAPKPGSKPKPLRKIYPGLDWGILADRFPDPSLYLSIRGGTTEVPHGHLDLGSFQCVSGRERLIDNLGPLGGPDYINTTFSPRRFELYEMSPAAQNTLLINGVGINRPSTVQTSSLLGKGWNAFRVDMTGAIWWGNPTDVSFCARLFLLCENGPFALIIDRVELELPGRIEARFHTFSRVRRSGMSAVIRGRRESLSLAFASSVPSALHQAADPLTTRPETTSTALRHCTNEATHRHIVFATLLAPDHAPQQIAVETKPQSLLVQCKIHGGEQTFRISNDLLKISKQRT